MHPGHMHITYSLDQAEKQTRMLCSTCGFVGVNRKSRVVMHKPAVHSLVAW